MKILLVLITFNRLAYTKRTLRSLWDTLEVPYYLIVVDNNSTDGTKSYLNTLQKRGRIDGLILNPENYYPGKATNIGWTEGLKEYPTATHLARIDNDMHFEKGWDKRAEEYFKTIDRLGQLGLDFDGGENKVPEYYNGMGLIEWPGCVGGPNIIRREIFNVAKYDEDKWEGSGSKIQEDSRFSRKIKQDGWLVGHMDERLSWTFANKDNWSKDYPDYYIKTFTDRGYYELAEEIKKSI